MSRLDIVLWVMTFWLSTNALSRQLKLTIVCSWITFGRLCGTVSALQLPSLAKSASPIPTFPLEKKVAPGHFSISLLSLRLEACGFLYINIQSRPCGWLYRSVYMYVYLPVVALLCNSVHFQTYARCHRVDRKLPQIKDCLWSRVNIGLLFQNLFSKLL